MSLGGGLSSALNSAVTNSVELGRDVRGRGRERGAERLQLLAGLDVCRAMTVGATTSTRRPRVLLELWQLRRSLRPR